MKKQEKVTVTGVVGAAITVAAIAVDDICYARHNRAVAAGVQSESAGIVQRTCAGLVDNMFHVGVAMVAYGSPGAAMNDCGLYRKVAGNGY